VTGVPGVALAGLVVVLVALTLVWAISLRLHDASIVDAFWGPGFALAALAYLVTHEGHTARGASVVVLVTLWALRLGTHLFRRNRREGEDRRYAAMRERYVARGGDWRIGSLFRVFWLQGVILWVISAPLLGAVVGTRSLGPLDVIGATFFLIGMSLEAVADLQLARFRADAANTGQVMDQGLWRYSRHPNYFGDTLLWWGLWLIAAGAGAYWTVFSPAIMTFLLLRVSGVTLLEKGLTRSRAGYADYVRRTSAFVPWPPKG
jgi:steroid 5-alpha reductase family enzyme